MVRLDLSSSHWLVCAVICAGSTGCPSDDLPLVVSGSSGGSSSSSSSGEESGADGSSSGGAALPTTTTHDETSGGGETSTGAVTASTTATSSGGETTGGESSDTSSGGVVCGDGVIEGDEVCDDGNLDDADLCDSNCVTTGCGDGVVQAVLGEACDDGPGNAADAMCTPSCQLAVCGDGLVLAGVETCDDGADNGAGQACKVDCTVNVCGDGDMGPLEGCDDGNVEGGDGCTDGCALEACGNGVMDPGEVCDDGGDGDNDDGCTDLCKSPMCGDQFVQASLGETCDDGAANADDAACTATCQAAVCGDGLVQAGVEQCDDADADDGDACVSSTCTLAVCGDGFLQVGVEACDDGNAVVGDGCDAACNKELVAVVEKLDMLLAIPDGVYDGTFDFMVCVDLPVANMNTVVGVEIKVGVTHTWVGDLIFRVVAPNNKVLQILSRPGSAETIDNGIGPPNGDSSNLDAGWPITFLNAGLKDAELMGSTINDNQVICKLDLQCSYKPNHGAGLGVDFNDFVGLPANGLWKFCVGDRLKFDLGVVDDVTLTLTLM